MATTTTVVCDRCGQPVTQGRTALKAECGPGLPMGTTDLCESCLHDWRAWLAEPKQADVSNMST